MKWRYNDVKTYAKNDPDLPLPAPTIRAYFWFCFSLINFFSNLKSSISSPSSPPSRHNDVEDDYKIFKESDDEELSVQTNIIYINET